MKSLRLKSEQHYQTQNGKNNDQGYAVIIFGASGDLTSRKVVPALFSLKRSRLLPETFNVIGVARSKFNDEEFRKELYGGIAKFSRIKPKGPRNWKEFSKSFSYLRGEYDDPETYERLKDRLSEKGKKYGKESNKKAENLNLLFYLATPPMLFPVIVEQLGKSGLSDSEHKHSSTKASSTPKRNVLIEKPFGRDLESARALNRKVHSIFEEDQVYRIDHYLGKETVQNILTFRFANTIFEPVWNRNYVDHIQITVAETIGVEHRAGYYDKAGVARDMLQNHLLQLVALTTMEPPVAFNQKELRDEKVKVFRTVRREFRKDDYVWGQYDGYMKEQGVSPKSRTPTYVALKLYLDNWRWQGVPIFLRTGKKLAKKSSEITIQFKHVPLLLFPGDSDVRPNRIAICVQPDEGIHLRFETKIPGIGMKSKPVDMRFHYSRFGKHALPEAYENLLLDAMYGDQSLFTRGDSVEESWSIVDPIIGTIEKGDAELYTYKGGEWGPKEADDLMTRNGVEWFPGCS